MSGDPVTPERRFEALARLPLFASFGEGELRQLAERFEGVAYRKGEVVWRRGDPPDAFLVIVRGELEVWGGADDAQVVNRMRPGECLGEMALLLDDARTATVTAGRAAKVLALRRDAFQAVVAESPKLLEQLAQMVARRLALLTRREAGGRQSTIVAVVARPGVKGKSLVASALAALLGAALDRAPAMVRLNAAGGHHEHRNGARAVGDLVEASAATLADSIASRRGGPSVLDVAVPSSAGEGALLDALDALTDRLSAQYPVVIVDACSDARLDASSLAETSDAIVEVVGRNEELASTTLAPGTRLFQVLNLLSNDARAIPINSSEPFVLPTELALVDRPASDAAEWLLDHPAAPAAVPLQRLARRLLGCSVGIAMGGGAAFGIAHVGVLKTLEENGIDVDLVAGTSFGSIVALAYAAGLRPPEMEEIAARIGNKRTTLSALDFTVSWPGLLAGRRLKAIFSPLYGSATTFEHLMLPCRAVATDIESGERVSIGTGRLEDAFRASCSVPMLWAPVRRDGRTLADGALVDPVPVAVTREMGADLCVGVNVVPTLKKGVTTVLSRASRTLNAFNPFAYLNDSRQMPNILDVGMNSLQVLQYELGNYRALAGDVRLNVDLSRYTWIEFYRATELIERGAEAAEAIVPELKRLIEDRVRALDGDRAGAAPRVPLAG